MASLRNDFRDWRRGVVSGAAVPLTLVIAGMGFLVAYGADLLARAYVRSMELIPGWFSLRVLEHGIVVPFPMLLLMGALLVVLPFGITPVASARLRWLTRRRWALVAAIAIGTGGVLSNGAELLQKGSITDFLLVDKLGDFSGGDVLMIGGFATALFLSTSPDYSAVRKRHVAFAIGAAAVGLIAVPLVRPPLNHLLPLTLLLAGVVWLTACLWWRVSVGNRLLRTLASNVPLDPGPKSDRALHDLERALQTSSHIDLAASAWALSKLAYAYRRLERRDDLRRTSHEYLRTAEEVDNHRMKEWALDYVGAAHALGDDLVQAEHAWRQALLLAELNGDDRHKLLLLANIAWAEAELDRTDDAQRSYTSGIELAERLGNTEMASLLRNALSVVRPSEPAGPGDAVDPSPA